MENKTMHTRKIGISGTTLMVTLPQQAIDCLRVKLGTEVKLTVEEGKYGEFVAIFNPNEKKKQ